MLQVNKLTINVPMMNDGLSRYIAIYPGTTIPPAEAPSSSENIRLKITPKPTAASITRPP